MLFEHLGTAGGSPGDNARLVDATPGDDGSAVAMIMMIGED